MHLRAYKDITDTVELIMAQYSLIRIQIRLNKDIWAEKSIGVFLANATKYSDSRNWPNFIYLGLIDKSEYVWHILICIPYLLYIFDP